MSTGYSKADFAKPFGQLVSNEYGTDGVWNGAKYYALSSRTQGFYVGNWEPRIDFAPSNLYFNHINVLYEEGNSVSRSLLDYVLRPAEFVISCLNAREGTDLTLKRLLRVNSQCFDDFVFFVTLEASDGKFYEAKVSQNISGEFQLLLLRPAVHYPTDPELLSLAKPK